MSKVSFLISTNRNYDTCARRVVDSIERQGALKNNEIIICSNDPMTDSRIINIEDKFKINGTLGFNQAAEAANGDFFVVLCDDHEVFINCDITKLFDGKNFDNRKYKILTMSTKQDGHRQCNIGPIGPKSLSYKKWLQGVNIDTSSIPKAKMCRFPILTRDTYEKMGNYIFHPNFNLKSSFFPDNYLSYFLYINGEESIQTKQVYLQSFQNQNDHGKKFYVKSLRIFLDLIDNVKSGDPYVK
jgi:hypothetical protein